MTITEKNWSKRLKLLLKKYQIKLKDLQKVYAGYDAYHAFIICYSLLMLTS